MALDPTLQESLYKLSIRKYFVDNLVTARGVYISFDKVYSIPVVNGLEMTNWIVFHFGPTKMDILSNALLFAYCFSRKDPDNVNLSVLRDKLMDTLFDHTATDGLQKIPYLNDARVKIGGIVPLVVNESEIELGADGSNVKTVSIRMNWGTK